MANQVNRIMNERSRLAVPWVTISVLLLIALPGCAGSRIVLDFAPSDDLVMTPVMTDPGSTEKIALIDVTGIILDAEQPGLLSRVENPVARFSEELRVAARDPNVRAVIVRINSPGGAVTASDVMYRELVHFRDETQRPVVVLMADVAASGGFYLACAGDEVIAHPTTVTGSIGVIMQMINFSEGMRRIGISADAITSGPNKAMGSPFAPMRAEQRELFQEIVNEFYGAFVSIVTERRPSLDAETISWVADGRVITGTRAAEIGLVDRTGDLYDAFDAAKHRAGLRRAQLV
jgi:protease-4